MSQWPRSLRDLLVVVRTLVSLEVGIADGGASSPSPSHSSRPGPGCEPAEEHTLDEAIAWCVCWLIPTGRSEDVGEGARSVVML